MNLVFACLNFGFFSNYAIAMESPVWKVPYFLSRVRYAFQISEKSVQKLPR